MKHPKLHNTTSFRPTVIALFLFYFLFSNIQHAFSQGIGINTTGGTPNSSAGLDIDFTDKGLLVPRLTQAQRNAIASPAASLLIYQTDNTPGYYYNNGTSGSPNWVQIFTSAMSGWSITGNSGTTAGTNFIGTTDSKDFVLKTNNTERFRITADGNALLGTTSASSLARFNIANGGGTNIAFPEDGALQFRWAEDNIHKIWYQEDIDALSYSSYQRMNFSLTNPTDQFDAGRYIFNDGRIGIGTDVPHATLSIAGGGTAIELPNDGIVDFRNAEDTNHKIWYNDPIDALCFQSFQRMNFTLTTPTNWFEAGRYIFNDGRIGIGTDVPMAYLSVKSDVTDGSKKTIRVSDDNDDTKLFVGSDGHIGINQDDASSGSIDIFSNGSSEGYRLTNEGCGSLRMWLGASDGSDGGVGLAYITRGGTATYGICIDQDCDGVETYGAVGICLDDIGNNSTNAPNSTLQVNGSLSVHTANFIQDDYTLTNRDYFINVITGGDTSIITLPSAATCQGRIYVIKNTDDLGGEIVIQPSNSEGIDDQDHYAMDGQYSTITIISDGVNWDIISLYIP